MRKIGAADKDTNSFIPSDHDQASFRKSKWTELKNQYYHSKNRKKQPFDHELDEIVLDCWEYGEDFGNKTIWKKYKQKFD